MILSTRGTGDFFGEMALLTDTSRSAHVIAMEDSRLLVLRREHFHRCLEEIPQMAIGLLRAMCVRLREADDKIGGLVLLPVPGRVARLLLRKADENDGVHLPGRITHQTIAQMVGSSRETVSRVLRNWATNGIIQVTGRKISLQHRGALEELAGLKRPPLSGIDRRSGEDRRKRQLPIDFPDRRSGIERRSGIGRRETDAMSSLGAQHPR